MRLPRLTKPYKLRDYKFSLVLLVFALSVIGVMVVGSAKASVQNKQIFGVCVGFILMIIVSLIDYVWILNFYWIIYAVAILSLLSVLVFGHSANGAKRWIDLGFTTFQPSELAKILLILFFARFLMDHKDDINDAVTLIKYAVLAGIPLALILVEPNLSTTICTALVICLLIYIGGLSYKFIGTVLLILVPVAIIFLSIAVQPTGKGLNNNTTTSVKNGNYISEPQTDFIFAIIGEELGFVGCCIIIALLLLVVIQCILIGMRSRDLAGKIICSGVGGLIGFQSFINISVATNMLPNTGVPLPFISYGLTSLVSLYIGIGFVLNVGLQQKKYQ